MLMAGHQWGLCYAGPSMTGQCLILKSHQDSQESCHQNSPTPGTAETTAGRQKGVNAIKTRNVMGCYCKIKVFCAAVCPLSPVCVLFCTGKGVLCEGLPSLDRQTAEACFDEANRCGRPLVCGFYK